nr:basic proline-rich protein-like [Globicephala melas]
MRLGDLAKTAPLGADGREHAPTAPGSPAPGSPSAQAPPAPGLPPPPAPLSPVPHCRPPGPSPAGAHSPRGFSRTADGSGGDARWAARAALPGGRAPLGSGAALGTPALCLPRAFPPSCGVAGAGSGTPAGSRARGGPAGEVRGSAAEVRPLTGSGGVGGAPRTGVAEGGVSPRPPRPLCHQVSLPMAGRMGKAGSLSRWGGEGKDQSPTLQAEGSSDVLWPPPGQEDLAEEEKAPPTPEPRPPGPAWGGQRRRAHGGRDGNVLRVQPGRKVLKPPSGGRSSLSAAHKHGDPRPVGTRRLLMPTPDDLTTSQSEECPRADHALFEPFL